MAAKMLRAGSQYASTEQGKDGNYLGGLKQLPSAHRVPAKDVWSVILYDPQTGSELQRTDDAIL